MSASAIAWTAQNAVPKEMDRADMDKVLLQFVKATEMAKICGFDMIELHAAHGYLISSFISPTSNHRTDTILPNQKLFFSTIEFDEYVYSENEKPLVSDLQNVDKLLLAGIAKPQTFFAHLQTNKEKCLTFPDHHQFTEKDLLEIKNKAQNNIIITTEKDFVRLKGSLPKEQLFYLPIKTKFLFEGDNFDKIITNYVESSTRIG
jgi:hypothetical protein